MSEVPGAQFGVSDQAVLDLVASLEKAGADDVVDAFPAALLAPTWRALLESGAIETPARVDVDRVEVRLVGPHALELRVPIVSGDGEFVRSVPVSVEKWSATGELANQLGEEAQRLVAALEMADLRDPFDHYTGTGQKPHN